MMSRDQNGRFKTGGKPGPGRPVGSRNRLTENFLATLYEDWTKNGAAVIARVRKSNPSAYLKIVSAVIPRDRDLPGPTQNQYDGVSDAELLSRLKEAAESLEQSIAKDEAAEATNATLRKTRSR